MGKLRPDALPTRKTKPLDATGCEAKLLSLNRASDAKGGKYLAVFIVNPKTTGKEQKENGKVYIKQPIKSK